jgi:bifunctional non-homologous end joining protein LigD
MAKLAQYRAKRDFQKTPEPQGGDASPVGSAFVIQKHAASRLHYDLRLELDGVMKSWAVTKGPSLVPGEKRLAVHVEDHPIEYNTFEGTIPKGQYGGGTVMLWDRGHWTAEDDPHKGYAKGHLNFRLEGEKLHGAWHLVRLKKRPGERQEAWLLIKSDDESARHAGDPDILEEMPRSIATGRDLEEIANDAGSAVWGSKTGLAADQRGATKADPEKPASKPKPRTTTKRADAASPGAKPAKRARRTRAKAAIDDSAVAAGEDPNEPAAAPDLAAGSGRKAAMPKEIEPCLATLVAEVPQGDVWLHEIKWDGYRLIAFRHNGKTRLATRRGHDWTHRFPGIATALDALGVESAILDGEAVIEDETGISNFSALQNALSDEHGGQADKAIFFGFDLLYLDGLDLRALPLEARKARLAEILPKDQTGTLRLSEHIDADGGAMVRSACRLGLEGIISKRRDRPYRSGRREDWLKIKCTERQEFVIAGFVPSTAMKKAVGSIALGYYEGGKLKYAGRSGTGFTAEAARQTWTQLDALRVAAPPFDGKLSSEERRGAVWVEPKLVAEIEFRGWTGDGRLRHAAYKGLREDKSAQEVVRETAKHAADASSEGSTGAPQRAKPAGAAKPGKTRTGVQVAGVTLTHPDRVLWPDAGVTKQGLAEYYDEIAEWLLPHIARRPLALVRCPSGVGEACFFQKHSWAGLGDAIRRETIRDEDGEEEVLFVDDIAGVVSLVQAGVLEIHPWGAGIADVDKPDRITMDLDPAEDVAWEHVIAAALDVRERLAAQGFESFVKTTGGKGLHVVVPFEPGPDWATVKSFARDLAEVMEREAPDRYIAKASKTARRGLIYVDYLRNGRGATAIGAYSTRARPGATVSVPLAWNELSPALKPNHFNVLNLPARLRRLDRDPWGDIAAARQSLPGRKAGKRR